MLTRVVLGEDEAAATVFLAAARLPGETFAVARPSSPLALAAGDRNITDPCAGSMMIIFCDELIDLDAA